MGAEVSQARTFRAMKLCNLMSDVEARDGIEPPSKALQILPSCFGFRALSHNVGIVTTAKQALQKLEPRFSPVDFMKSLPRKNP